MNKTIGIIGAMESELELINEKLEFTCHEEHYGIKFTVGNIGDNRVVAALAGIGKVNASRCTQLLIDIYKPDYIVNTGIAGGVAQGLKVGDFVIGEECVQHDFDVTVFGHAKGYLCTGVKPEEPTVFHADESLADALENAAKHCGASRVLRGRIATGDVFVADLELKKALASEFGAAAAEMEGGAIAQVASMCGVPFVVARSISDLADGSGAAESFETFEKKTAEISAEIVLRLAECEL